MAETTTPETTSVGPAEPVSPRVRAPQTRGHGGTQRGQEQAEAPGAAVSSLQRGSAPPISGLTPGLGARLDAQEARLQEVSEHVARLARRLEALTNAAEPRRLQEEPPAGGAEAGARPAPWFAPMAARPDGGERAASLAAAWPASGTSGLPQQRLEGALLQAVQPLADRLDALGQLVQERSATLQSLLAATAQRLEAVQATVAQQEAENLGDVGLQVAGLRRALQEQAAALRAYADTHASVRPALPVAGPLSEGERASAQAALLNLARSLEAGSHAGGR